MAIVAIRAHGPLKINDALRIVKNMLLRCHHDTKRFPFHLSMRETSGVGGNL